MASTKYPILNMNTVKGESTALVNQENISPNSNANAAVGPVNEKEEELYRQFGLNIINMQKEKKDRKRLEAKHSSMIKFLNKGKQNNKKDLTQAKPNHFKIEYSVKDNPQYLYDYSNEIYSYLKENESVNTPNYDSIALTQKHITTKQRRILVEWLIKIHWRFSFLNDTLYLAINLLDRYLSSLIVSLEDFQLLGVAVLFIASKYEEIYPPDVCEFAHLTDNKVKSKDIVKMEYRILTKLQFDILTVHANYFIKRYHFLSGLNEEVLHLSQFLLELVLMNVMCLNFPHSVKAAAALLLSIKILRIESGDYNADYSSSKIWSNSLRLITGFAAEDLKRCYSSMLQLIKVKHQEAGVIIQKYSSKKYMNVSRFFKEKSP